MIFKSLCIKLKVKGGISMNRLYLITGANGHLGYTISKILRTQAKHVRGLVLPDDKALRLEALGVDIYHGDVTITDSMLNFFSLDSQKYNYDDVVLIHTAGIVSITHKKNPLIEKVNVEGTKNLIFLAKHFKIQKFIYVSSVHAIPEPLDEHIISEVIHFDPKVVEGAYAKSKAKASQHVMDEINNGFKAIIVHPSGIIGPDDEGHGHMTMMIEDYMNGMLTSRVDGAYDFVDVRDVALGIIAAIDDGQLGHAYIISGTRVTLKDLFEILRQLSGRKRKIHVLPRWFAKVSAPMAELFYRLRKLPPIYSKYSLYTLSSNSYFDHSKAALELNYSPRPIEETLRDTVYWLEEVNRIKRQKIRSFIQSIRLLKKKSGS